MSLLERLTQLFRDEAEHKVNVILAPDHIVPSPSDTAPAVAGEAYFRFWIVQMFLKNDRDWFKTDIIADVHLDARLMRLVGRIERRRR